MRTKILIVDDHKMFREALRSLLEAQETLEVVGEAEDGRSGVAQARKLHPDVVVMDVGMTGLNGVGATRQITRGASDVKVIGLSMHSDSRFVTQMLRAGASGYLIKDGASEELAEAVKTVRAGHYYLSPEVSDGVIRHYLNLLADSELLGPSGLTPREREVVQLLAEGRTSKQIAAVLHVSIKTVDAHRKNALDKLHLEGIAGLTKFAVREGLTTLGE